MFDAYNQTEHYRHIYSMKQCYNLGDGTFCGLLKELLVFVRKVLRYSLAKYVSSVRDMFMCLLKNLLGI